MVDQTISGGDLLTDVDESKVDRRAQIILLLETMTDGLPQRDRPKLTAPGFVHRAIVRESCSDCLANDRRRPGCATCGGKGFTETFRDRDPYADTETVQPYGITPDRHEAARAREAAMARLEAQTREPWKSDEDELADANKNPEPWEIERRRMYRLYDYAALDSALALLRDRDEGAYRLLHSVYVYGWSEPSTTVEALVERGLLFVEQRMPEVIRAPGFDNPAKAKLESRRARAA